MSVAVKSESKTEIAELLKRVAADQFVLYTKVRNYHWNVTGNLFLVLHQVFEKIYDELAEDIDVVAERIRALGEHAPGTMSEFTKLSRIKEEREGVVPDQIKMTRNIVSDLTTVVNELKESINRFEDEYQDEVTAGILIDLTEKYEKHIWMLRATIDEK
ncbi:MAG: Dps family protein [Bacteroidota bacterium]